MFTLLKDKLHIRPLFTGYQDPFPGSKVVREWSQPFTSV